MSTHKDEKNGTWYVMVRYHDWKGEKKQKCNGTADIGEKYLKVIQETARQYVAGIMRRLREHEYNPELMKLYIVGGGGCLIRHFGEYDPNRVTINDDICATAKGYEFLANLKLKKANAA